MFWYFIQNQLIYFCVWNPPPRHNLHYNVNVFFNYFLLGCSKTAWRRGSIEALFVGMFKFTSPIFIHMDVHLEWNHPSESFTMYSLDGAINPSNKHLLNSQNWEGFEEALNKTTGRKGEDFFIFPVCRIYFIAKLHSCNVILFLPYEYSQSH